jgi:hypothetical protein
VGLGPHRSDAQPDPQGDLRRAQHSPPEHPFVGRAPRRDDLEVVGLVTQTRRKQGTEVELDGSGGAQVLEHVGEQGLQHLVQPSGEAVRVADLGGAAPIPVEGRLHRVGEWRVVPLDQGDAKTDA